MNTNTKVVSRVNDGELIQWQIDEDDWPFSVQVPTTRPDPLLLPPQNQTQKPHVVTTTPEPAPAAKPAPGPTSPPTTTPKPRPTAYRTRSSKSMYFWPLDVDEKLSDKRHTSLPEIYSSWAWWLSAEAWRNEGRLPYNLTTLALMANAKNRKRFVQEFHVLVDVGLFIISEDEAYIESPDLRELWLDKVEISKTNRTNSAKKHQGE